MLQKIISFAFIFRNKLLCCLSRLDKKWCNGERENWENFMLCLKLFSQRGRKFWDVLRCCVVCGRGCFKRGEEETSTDESRCKHPCSTCMLIGVKGPLKGESNHFNWKKADFGEISIELWKYFIFESKNPLVKASYTDFGKTKL